MVNRIIQITKIDSDFLSVLFAIILVSFVCMMPPFLGSGSNSLPIRLALEILVLGGLSMYLLSQRRLNPLVSVILVFALYMMNWIFSAENIRQVLSHFNKLALLLLLSKVLVMNYPLTDFLKRLWVIMWVGFSIMAIVVFLLDVSGLMKMSRLNGYSYIYYHYSYLGSVLFKNIAGVMVPRYTGFLYEPIVFSFFSGFNMVAARWLFINRRRMQYFFVLNMVAGLLTFSFAFYIFVILFFVFWKYITRIPSKYVVVGGICFIIISGLVASNVSVPYTSFDNRIDRYSRSIEYIREFNVYDILFGVGIMPFLRGIGSGSASALIDIFVSRGIFLFFAWTYFLHVRNKYIPGLFFFIIFYSLFVNVWNFPLFVVGVAIVTSYSQIILSDSSGYARIQYQ